MKVLTYGKRRNTGSFRGHNKLSNFLSRYYGKKVIILLDEYDTPMQEAYLNGYWNEAVQFFRSLFNAAFKTNPYMERSIITGITRISKESIFSDLNNLEVITTMSDSYTTALGFTQDEVFAAMDEFGNEIALNSFSNFDVAKNSSGKDAPERFYHGFVLGLMVELDGRYEIKSNRESGFGRYDVMLIPTDRANDNAYIIEFKVKKAPRGKNRGHAEKRPNPNRRKTL